MSLFRDSKGIRLFDKDSYVFHDGRTASQIMDKTEQTYGNESTSNIKISNLQKSGAINKNNGNFDVRNPVMANFASPSTFGSFGSGAGSGLLYTSPQFYSPIHTATNWQIPTKRREVYQWQITENSGLMLDDLTFILVKDLDFIPKEITKDTLTDGVVFENIKSQKVFGGEGRLRNPVNFFECPNTDQEYVKFKVHGSWRKLEAHKEHNIYVVKGKPLRNETKKYGDKLYRNGHKGKFGKKDYMENKSWPIERIPADEVEKGDFLLFPVPNSKPLTDEDIKEVQYQLSITSNNTNLTLKPYNYEEDMDFHWLVGLCIADGSLNESGFFGYTKYNCSISEPSIIDNLKRILKQKYDELLLVDIPHTNSDKCRRIYCENKKSYEDMSRYITGKLANKKFNSIILSLSKEQLLSILGGYFDGDGSFTSQNKLVANNVSCDMADQIYHMCIMCGIHASIGECKRTDDHYDTPNDEYYRIFVPASDLHILKPYMKSNKIPENFEFDGNDRTLKFFFTGEDGVRYYAQQVAGVEEYFYTGIGYDIQIDPERSYVASGYKVSNCRFFSQNDPTIASSLRFYSRFPFNGFELQMSDPVRKEHFENLCKRLKVKHWLPLMAFDYFSMGDCFAFVSIQTPNSGSGFHNGADPIDYTNAKITGISILNPDTVEVIFNPMNPINNFMNLTIDDNLKKIVWEKKPIQVYQSLPEWLKFYVQKNLPIPLHPDNITHLKHDERAVAPYGVSILVPLFPTLAYQDKLRQAQWIVAERHILPIKICKIGNDQRPAGPQDIADTQSQLGATANDPNLTLVVHHAFDFQWVGAAGKVLQLTKEYELIEKALIKGLGVNEALLSGCVPEYSRILTNDGFKTLDEFDQEKHLVASLNPETHEFEWSKPTYTHVVDYNSEDGIDPPLVHFKDKKRLDNLFTTGHEMYVKKRNKKTYEKIRADQVGHHDKFILKTNGWNGIVPEDIEEKTLGIQLDEFIELSSYFLSEGSFIKEYNRKEKTGETYICSITGKNRSTRQKIGISFVQSVNSDIIDNMFSLDERIKESKFHIHNWVTSHDNKSDIVCFRLNSVKLADRFFEYFGEYSYGKKIPNWIKDLPKENLEKLVYNLAKCDGTEREANRKDPNGKKYYTYTSCSEKLIHDISEVLLKIGFTPVMKCVDPNKYSSSKKFKNPVQLQYTVAWSEADKHGQYPCVRQSTERRNIHEKKWKGRVWCVTAPPNHLVLFENNGKMIWTGNTGPSYSQAAIGIEATIDRLEGVRNIFSEWLEEKVFKIEALIQGFYKTDLSGNKVLDYPTVKWKDLSLRDETQKKNQMLQLWDKKIVSTQYVCEEFGIDYDIETERIRLETEYQQQLGIMPDDDGGGKGKGGLGGGLGGGFGGGGGKGGLGGDPMKGNLPGGQSGPGLPGDSNAPSMSGGDVEASHDFRLRAHEDALKTKPKVYRPGKYDLKKPKPPVIQKQKEEMEQGIVLDGRTGQFRLTSIEAALYKSVKSGIEQGNLPPDFIIQQKPEPVEMSRVIVDGFWPSLKLIIEADGKMWHDNPEKINTDTERDDRFRALGWTVLRFTEDEIEHQIENVLAKIIDSAKGIIEYKQPKTASAIKEIVEASEEIEIEQVYEESFLTGEWFEIE